jgi:8-oxo-dGTP pyrophosphatase MutT (NUDIX family)
MLAPRRPAAVPHGVPRLADVRSALRDTLPRHAYDGDGRVAAVAAVLRERDGRAELLFIRRATRRGDPWSGHMAWPGGKREPGDGDLLACAVRETREEIGLDLAGAADVIGTLRGWRNDGRSPGRLQGVFPYVFALRPSATAASAPFLLDPAEVQEAVWVPLSYFTAWRCRRPWAFLARWLPAVPPAYRYEGRLIWGLTQWMLADLIERVTR